MVHPGCPTFDHDHITVSPLALEACKRSLKKILVLLVKMSRKAAAWIEHVFTDQATSRSCFRKLSAWSLLPAAFVWQAWREHDAVAPLHVIAPLLNPFHHVPPSAQTVALGAREWTVKCPLDMMDILIVPCILMFPVSNTSDRTQLDFFVLALGCGLRSRIQGDRARIDRTI
ncbi:hypothetical protein N656DRAFT_361881 [Canariomyces notabilis]|uniref:Uncharacterized protein n=1 Tax=Canariomyces notabilis TaxID=2074819 RepID=A0AAN6QEW1_9PEZI|nr:hypothetical protein N656DRAFT_361881 [Canariomyces arenarius]